MKCFIKLFAIVILVGASACQKDRNGAKASPVLVLAAASTKEAMQENTRQFTQETGIEVKISADDSSKLAQQIDNGAPADLFLSANETWADLVKENGHAEATKKLLGNALVIVTPKGNKVGVTKPEDLQKDGVKKIALAGPTVPAGIYARQSLKHLHLWEALESAGKFVPGENVRVTLSLVERGECEAGIVYSTDAKITDRVENVYTFDSKSHDQIVYPLMLLKTDNKSAMKLYDYLQSSHSLEVFRKYGFAILNGS
jgi:molybdate transport system substrate-binding protein